MFSRSKDGGRKMLDGPLSWFSPQCEGGEDTYAYTHLIQQNIEK